MNHPKHLLSHRIVKHLAKDERETDKRYIYLGKHYKLPKLVAAGKQEGGHAKIFEKLETKKSFRVKPTKEAEDWVGVFRVR